MRLAYKSHLLDEHISLICNNYILLYLYHFNEPNMEVFFTALSYLIDEKMHIK